MQIDSDLPYLEPLLMWLRNDESLKPYFTDKSFFMPKLDLQKAADEALKGDCPSPTALWIFPMDTDAASTTTECRSAGTHSFAIVLWVQCIRESFELVKRDGEVVLGGQFMELTTMRKAVKKSIAAFAKDNTSKFPNRFFEKVIWLRDRNLYPQEDSFLGTSIEYRVNIL